MRLRHIRYIFLLIIYFSSFNIVLIILSHIKIVIIYLIEIFLLKIDGKIQRHDISLKLIHHVIFLSISNKLCHKQTLTTNFDKLWILQSHLFLFLVCLFLWLMFRARLVVILVEVFLFEVFSAIVFMWKTLLW